MDETRKGMRIAVAGKGGAGKTVLSAIMAKLLAADLDGSLLLVDADSAVSLPYALGLQPARTVAEIRRRMIEDPYERDRIKDINIRAVMEETLAAGHGFHLLVMGRPEGPGCYCSVNDLIRYGIERLSARYAITLVDCEAGPEQVNRRVVEGVDHLIIVTDGSLRSARAARSILQVTRCDASVRPAVTSLVFNRWTGKDPAPDPLDDLRNLPVLGRVPEDKNITEFDRIGRPLLELPGDSPAVSAVARILENLNGPKAGPP